MDHRINPSAGTLPAGRRHPVLALVAATVLLAGCTTSGSLAQSMSRQQPDSDSFTSDNTGPVPPDVLKIPQFPVPPHATVVLADTVIIGDDEDWSGQVFLVAPYTVIQITQFYRTEMPKNGWIETAIVRSRRTSISYTRGNRVATLRLSPQKDDSRGTDIDLVISPIQTQGTGRRPGSSPYGGVGTAPLSPPASSRPHP
ncbi:MAG: hypothetical protein WCO00_17800 [Rhodospirillaceae bacterium]